MLIGNYSHTMDAKGRVFVPAKFRDDLGNNFIVCQGIGKCLFAFSGAMWTELTEKFRTLPMTDTQIQDFLRLLYSSATECEPDKQGRILLPAKLRERAELEKDVTIVGLMTRAEIWSSENWEKHNDRVYDEYEKNLSKLAGTGI